VTVDHVRNHVLFPRTTVMLGRAISPRLQSCSETWDQKWPRLKVFQPLEIEAFSYSTGYDFGEEFTTCNKEDYSHISPSYILPSLSTEPSYPRTESRRILSPFATLQVCGVVAIDHVGDYVLFPNEHWQNQPNLQFLRHNNIHVRRLCYLGGSDWS